VLSFNNKFQSVSPDGGKKVQCNESVAVGKETFCAIHKIHILQQNLLKDSKN
jgi:hypothetical protein